MLLNAKKSEVEENINDMNVNIGNVKVNRQSAAKLLGMKFEDNLKWSEHIHGKGGVIPSLNKRLFLLRRLKSQLNKQSLRKVAEAIFTSKIRYGLQLLGKVRVKINVTEGSLRNRGS